MVYDFGKANFSTFHESLSDFVWNFDVGNNVDTLTEWLSHVIGDVIDNFVSKKISCASDHPPWFDEALINLKNVKNKSHRKWVASSCEKYLALSETNK